MSDTLYQVIDWNDNFEGAKSRTYNNKTTCQMPTKHGLGYRKLVKRKDGAALFGAWCALIQVLSRHPKPREGYCTDTGQIQGNPYTAGDLELLTEIPERIFKSLLEVALSQAVGWLRIPDGYQADTTGSLHSNLDLDSNSDSLSSEPDKPDTEPPHTRISFDYEIGKILGIIPSDDEYLAETYPSIDVKQTTSSASAWLFANPAKRKKNVWRFLINWCQRDQEKGGALRGGRKGKQEVEYIG